MQSVAEFRPGCPWRDSQGHLIEAHTGGTFRQDGVYYWFGADWRGSDWFQGFNMYRSTNLAEWSFVRTVLRPSSTLPSDHEIARPKILYNRQTHTYVMWFKRKDRRAEFNDVRPGIATAPTLDGRYEYLKDFYPGTPEYNAADFCLWQEADGAAYYIASCPQRRGGPRRRRIVIFRLTTDYLNVEPEPVYVGPVDNREAPAIFKSNATYYLVTSGTTGWMPNQAAYQTAPSLTGPWSELRPLGDLTTYDSQPDFILTVTGRRGVTHIYSGGRHVGTDLATSSYVWLPLEITAAGILKLAFQPAWRLDLTAGTWEPTKP